MATHAETFDLREQIAERVTDTLNTRLDGQADFDLAQVIAEDLMRHFTITRERDHLQPMPESTSYWAKVALAEAKARANYVPDPRRCGHPMGRATYRCSDGTLQVRCAVCGSVEQL